MSILMILSSTTQHHHTVRMHTTILHITSQCILTFRISLYTYICTAPITQITPSLHHCTLTTLPSPQVTITSPHPSSPYFHHYTYHASLTSSPHFPQHTHHTSFNTHHYHTSLTSPLHINPHYHSLSPNTTCTYESAIPLQQVWSQTTPNLPRQSFAEIDTSSLHLRLNVSPGIFYRPRGSRVQFPGICTAGILDTWRWVHTHAWFAVMMLYTRNKNTLRTHS